MGPGLCPPIPLFHHQLPPPTKEHSWTPAPQMWRLWWNWGMLPSSIPSQEEAGLWPQTRCAEKLWGRRQGLTPRPGQ